MKIYYSPSKGGFYNDTLHKDAMPDDVVEVSAEVHAALMEGQGAGQKIVAGDNGAPILQDPEPLSATDQIKAEIAAKEALQTPRRIRDAIAGADNGWLAALESEIEELRAQL
ncbi:MAG: hypothetical protein AB7S81_08345 [Bdellovibrionales bacterium]